MDMDSLTPKPTPRLGVLAFVLAISSLLFMCAYGMWGATLILNSGPTALDGMTGIGTAINIACILLLLAAVVLGIVSLVRREPNGGWGFAGMVLAVLTLLGYGALLMMFLAA
jgi:hypothetical protein